MGQVFTWDSIRRNEVPDAGSFEHVLSDLREELPGEESIVGAVVCGSVLRGEHTLRSDIDCFILYDHRRERDAFAYMRQAIAVALDRCVPFSFIFCDTLLARTRMHHIGDSFLRHLQRSSEMDGLLKGNPLEHVAPSVREQEELESYLRVKMYNLQEAYAQSATFSDERRATYLKKLYEAPVHVARKVLAILEPLQSDSKSFVRSRYRELLPHNMVLQLEALITADEEYTALFPEAVGEWWEDEYRAYLSTMMGRSEDVLNFIRSNLAFIATTAR